jgi:hypothetical protein
MMNPVSTQESTSSPVRLLLSPWLWLGLFLCGLLLLLSLPVRLPIGPNYWDIAVYLDGGHRLSLGHMPHRDFFAPVGGLSYLMFRSVELIWPNAHPLLIVQWCVLIVALAPVVIATAHVARSSRGQALALLLPFLFFAAVPINGLELYPSPGFDAYGNYNRHICLLLYALMAVLWRMPQGRLKLLLALWLMAGLIGIKITGFLVGLGLFLHATVAGRVGWKGFALVLAALAAGLVLTDFTTGMVRAYVADILSLVAMNRGSLAARFLTVASLEFDVLAGGALLVLALLAAEWRGVMAERALVSTDFIRALADSHAARIGVALIGGALFETQNTGSQEFIFLWPVVVPAMVAAWCALPGEALFRWRALILVLAAVTLMPHGMKILHRTARAVASAPGYAALQAPHLGPLGRVSAKPEHLRRAEILLDHYVTHRAAYVALADKDELPSAILFSELDYQLAWLMGVDRAIAALKAHEASTGRRLASLYALDFVDIFSSILERDTALHVPIGLDAFRTFPEPDAAIIDDLRRVEGILVPSCPVTHARRIIAERFAPALEGRERIELTPCWALHVKR